MYLLGVDAGGTKCEFMITDLQKNEQIENFEILEGCNLKYVPPEKVIETLDKGLNRIFEKYDSEDFDFAYFGVAECGKGVGKDQDKIKTFISKYFRYFELADDQYSCFRSMSDSKSGVLAIAGTGTAVSYFSENKDNIHKSIGTGGRDFGKIIFNSVISGKIKKDSEIYKTLTSFLETDPKEFYLSLKGYDLVVHPKITKVAKALISGYENKPKLKEEVDIYLDVAVARWVTKLCSYCFTHFGYNENSEFDLVMIGSFWRSEYLRENVTKEVKRCFPKVNVLCSFDVHPVTGCLKIASERSNTIKLRDL